MKRKVNQVGPATLMVSLPAKWVKEHNIKKGDEINVIEKGDTLCIGGEGIPQKLKTTIDLKQIPDIATATQNFYNRLISNLYKRGYDEIEILFPEKNVYHKIVQATKVLMGYEIFDQTDKKCVIKSLANEKPEEFDSMVRKIYLLINQASETCYNDLKNSQYDNQENIVSMLENVAKMQNFCRRLINKGVYPNKDIAQYYYIIIMRLNLIMNKLRYIYDYAVKHKKVNKETLDYFKKTNEMIRTFYETNYKKEIKNLEKIDRIKTELIKKTYTILAKNKGHDNVIVYHLAEIVRLIYNNSSQLMGIIV